jgi:uncharacterized protein (DUF3084 family)
MSTGYILILAILILGGVIATVGDRLGTKVGKARLSLFNLRPRKTAVLITILTGSIISASTLGVLLAIDDQLYQGIFQLKKIQNQLSRITKEYEKAVTQKRQVDAELGKAQSQRVAAQKRLDAINRSLDVAIARQKRTQQERDRAQAERDRAQAQRERTQAQLSTVSQQKAALLAEIRTIQTEREKLIRQRNQELAVRDQVIAKRDQEIAEKEKEIVEREVLLKELAKQQEYLALEVRRLERESQGLRQGNFALQRGQVLASGVLRIVDPKAARQAIDQLLVEANRSAGQATQPGITPVEGQVIQITKAEVEQVIDEIDDGQDYVIRIVAAANYLVGEKPVQVFADAIRNQVVFLAGDVVAASSVDPSGMTTEQLQQQINLLFAASNFRARRLGILNDTVQIGQIQKVINFIEELKKYKEPIDIKTVTTDVTYTAGPLKVNLVATRNGEVLFSTQ